MAWALVWLAAGLLPGCRPSYPGGQVTEAISRICEKEYGVTVQVKTVGKTIGAQIILRDMLLEDLTLSDRALNKIENVMMTASRVTLSSDSAYDFFVIAMVDEATGVRVSFIRYVKDIRRLIHDDISRTDYIQRMLIDVAVQPLAAPGQEPPFVLANVDLHEFLARQIAERVKTQIKMNLIVEPLFHVAGVQGEFLPAVSGAGRLRLVLDFLDGQPAFATIGTPALREHFLKSIQQVAQTVVRRYETLDLAGLEIVDTQGQVLATYGQEAFSKDGMNALMELIRNIKGGAK